MNVADKQLRALQLTAKGAISGEYSNPGGADLREPFTAEIDFQGALPKPLSPQQLHQVEKLVKSLGDDSFAERERATKQLRQLGPEIAHHPRKLTRTVQDAEVRYRVTQLANELGN